MEGQDGIIWDCLFLQNMRHYFMRIRFLQTSRNNSLLSNGVSVMAKRVRLIVDGVTGLKPGVGMGWRWGMVLSFIRWSMRGVTPWWLFSGDMQRMSGRDLMLRAL